MATGVAMARATNSHRHQPLVCPRTRMAIAAYRQTVAATCPDG